MIYYSPYFDRWFHFGTPQGVRCGDHEEQPKWRPKKVRPWYHSGPLIA